MASIKDIESAVAGDEEIVDIVIYARDGEPYRAADGSESTIGVVGRESKAYRAAEARVSRKIMKGGRRRLTPEEMLAMRIERAASAVKRWHGWEDGKKELEPTPENVKQVIQHQHILEQVEVGIEDHSAFFSTASTG